MFCPGCGKRLGVPEGFELPELLKCQTCAAEWLLIKGSRSWVAVAHAKAKSKSKEMKADG